MKSIKTLVRDIQALLKNNGPFNKEAVDGFASALSTKIVERLGERKGKPSLRLSNLGTSCNRKLWYSINRPELAEPLSASTRLKFLFGDILEEVLIFLSRASGHTVTREQEEVEVNGVRGHLDAFVDGELVDFKSASTYSFRKFRDGGLTSDDPFGYITQLGGYACGTSVRRGHFVVVDKTLGNLCLDTHDLPDTDYDKLIDDNREMLAWPQPPERGYKDEFDGKSGNRKLGVACSYCPFKSHCWPGLRAFNYAGRPVFLTKVERLPKVQELTLSEATQED
jgi:hypothetical protein